MTAKEKAESLIRENFLTLQRAIELGVTQRLKHSKSLAKIIVNDVLATIEGNPQNHKNVHSNKIQDEYDWWKDVRNEIDSL